VIRDAVDNRNICARHTRNNSFCVFQIIHGKNDLAQVFRNLAKYKSKNNFGPKYINIYKYI